MLKELENKIKELQEKRENIKKSRDSLLESDKDTEYLQGVYTGLRCELLDEIKYLKSLVKLLKGE